MNFFDTGKASSEQVARDVLDNLHEGCQVIGPDWRYLYVNKALTAQGQRSKKELLGRTMMECYPGIEATPVFAAIQKCMATRKRARMENEFTFPDGSTGWFELRLMPVPEGVCVLSLDVTETKRNAAALARTEEQLRHAQKMDAVGRLAAGVAHDFNNLLSVVMSYAGLLLMDIPSDDPMHSDVEEINKASERAAELTRQLLIFSRQQVMEPRIVNLNEIITGMEKMLSRLLREDIEVKTALAGDLGKIKADPSQLEQVLMNLVVNARDAMPQGGTLTLETHNTELEENDVLEHLGIPPGPCILLAVSDTGTGMDKETRGRIFEPFFTTKEKGKGTGLGLSTVFGIVRQSGGYIWVYSEPGKGSTFKIYLPRTDETEKKRKAPAPVDTMRGTETVLLVEDEDQLRRVTGDILRRYGYHVLEAPNGAEALSLCEQHEDPIHLLLTDVVMPHISGPQLATLLLPRRTDLRVLYMSGYTEEAIVHHGVLSPGISLLQKPLTPQRLLQRVRQVLDIPQTP